MKQHKSYDSKAIALFLIDAVQQKDHILADENLYNQELDWFKSGGSFCGNLPITVGHILECWDAGYPFILPDGRRIFHFQGGLSGRCCGSAINLDTGEISSFHSDSENKLSFPHLWRGWASVRRAHAQKDTKKPSTE